jgi:hypothetical protein
MKVLGDPFAAIDQDGFDVLRLEPILDELLDHGLIEFLAGVNIDTDELVIGGGVDLDAALDDGNPAAVARLSRERRFARLEDIRLSLLRHLEVKADLIEKLVSSIEVATGVEVATEAVDDQLEAPGIDMPVLGPQRLVGHEILLSTKHVVTRKPSTALSQAGWIHNSLKRTLATSNKNQSSRSSSPPDGSQSDSPASTLNQ